MKKALTTLILLILSTSLVFAVHRPNDWIKFDSPQGRYTISFPSEPNLKTQEATAQTGDKVTQYMASVFDGDIVFVVGYYDSPPGTIFSADSARNGMVAKINAKVIGESQINLDGCAGRDLTLTAKTLSKRSGDATPEEAKSTEIDYLVRVRFCEFDKRIYILQGIFPKAVESDVINARVKRFFESFQVVKSGV